MNIKKILTNQINEVFKNHNLINKNIIKILYFDNKFGDYEISGFINILLYLNYDKKKFIYFINKIINKIKKNSFIYKLEFKSNNFINIYIKNIWIIKKVKKMISSNKLDVYRQSKKKIMIDYSSPNVSKDLHIGHLRSIILGDSYFRVSKFLGNDTYKVNHIGDWGINLSIIINEIQEKNINIKKSISSLEEIYIKSKEKYIKNKKFNKKSNIYLKKLNENNKNIKKIWKNIVNISIKNNNLIYRMLDTKLNNNDIIGESFYQKFLPLIIKDLKKKKIAFKKNNLIIIPFKNKKNKFKKLKNLIIRKSNGNYLYSTSEIASIRYRCKYLFMDEIIYYIDSRQKNHLLESIYIAKKAKYINKNTKIKHHDFGIILDENNNVFSTRSNNSYKLINLIKKCIQETKKNIIKKNKKLEKDKYLNNIINIIAIGSLKYFDLSKHRLTNYSINWENMFSINNNTLIYIQYSYIRINSILKKCNINQIYLKKINVNNIIFENNEEKKILILLIKFEEIIHTVFDNGTPNILCLYIYKISKLFSNFYNKYKIINDKNKKISDIKIILIILMSKIIKKGLYLLGIKTVKKI